MRNSTIVYMFEMESVPKITILGLQMIVRIGLEICFEIPPCGKKLIFKLAVHLPDEQSFYTDRNNFEDSY